jgi:hypothetical protein
MLIFDAIKYCFSDPRWPSKSLATTFSYILLFPPFGYATRITQQVSRGQEKGLPEHDFGTEFVYGLGVMLISALYQIPTYFIYRATLEGIAPSLSRLGSISNIGNSLNQVNALLSNIAGFSLTGWLLVQFFGFFFWVGFVLWAVDGNIANFFNLPKIVSLIREKPVLLVSNYAQQFVAGILVYWLTIISTICICLPFFFAPFYIFVYGYVTGRTAKALELRAPEPDEIKDFKGDI